MWVVLVRPSMQCQPVYVEFSKARRLGFRRAQAGSRSPYPAQDSEYILVAHYVEPPSWSSVNLSTDHPNAQLPTPLSSPDVGNIFSLVCPNQYPHLIERKTTLASSVSPVPHEKYMAVSFKEL